MRNEFQNFRSNAGPRFGPVVSRQSNPLLWFVYNMSSPSRSYIYPSGYHPWFSHLICIHRDVSKENHFRELFGISNDKDLTALNDLLPNLSNPIPLDDMLLELRQNLEAFPHAMLGEVGLDRSFRIPYDYGESPRKLSPFTVPITHQLVVLQAQIDLAVELGRNISLHSVKSHQATMQLLANSKAKHSVRWNKISLDMHSCGFSLEMWKDIEVVPPSNVP